MSARALPWIVVGGALLLGAGAAEAKFLNINGLDRADLAKHRVSVALVRVRSLTVKWRTEHALSGLLALEHEDQLFGPKPSRAALASVPYRAGAGYNSAWPDLGPRPAGTHLVMAWRKELPCGEGSAVQMGERFSLPLVVSGAADDRVSAVRAVLATVSAADEILRRPRLKRVFADSTNVYLVLFVDAALVAADATHRHSAARYARLFHLVNGAPSADEQLGWPLMQELARFPPMRAAEAYEVWTRGSRGPAVDGAWPPFADFRRLVQQRFGAFAASPRAEANLRRWALVALSVSPSFVAARGDRLDARAVALVSEQLRDPTTEIRREAIKSLLAMAVAKRSTDRAGAQRLVAVVRRAQRREKDSEERALIQQKIDELWGKLGSTP